MELVKRYIAAVQRELPEAKRADIGRELQANIMDEIEAQQGSADTITEQQVAVILRNMGEPRAVAWQFCPPAPLIAPHLMPLYQHTLYMVLGVLFVLQLVKAAGQTLSAAELQLWYLVKGLTSGWLELAVFAFTVITLTYMAITRDQPSPKAANWEPLKLPPADASWQHIRLSDIFTDLATYVFLLVMISYPWWQQWFAGVRVYSPFTGQTLAVLYAFSPLLVIGIGHSLWQLHRRFWSVAMLKLNIAINLAFALVIGWLAFNGPVLNLDPAYWQGVFNVDQVERVASTTLLIIALFPGYELVRDWRRLRKGAGS